MPAIKHMAMCTNNNRRLARFYQLILGMEEVWNAEENSPYPFYVTDGYFNLNCLQIYPALAEEKRDVGINHYGFKVENLADIQKRLAELDPPIKLTSGLRMGGTRSSAFAIPTVTASTLRKRVGAQTVKHDCLPSGMSESKQKILIGWPTFINLSFQ
jgi:catechol 2,3-dioxygenase-like lactoylglutathione lyase family enzyme